MILFGHEIRTYLLKISCLILCFIALITKVYAQSSLYNLQKAYPDHIYHVTSYTISWHDGTRMAIHSESRVKNWLANLFYRYNTSYGSLSEIQIAHDLYEPVFRKMYGNSVGEVKKNIVTIYWLKNIFGKKYPLHVTSVNGVDKQLMLVSNELEQLGPAYYKYLEKPASSFYWRNVAGEGYLSMHSFGIAIDINLKYSNYWLWDFLKLKKPISQLRYHKLVYHNQIPSQIVEVFAKHGFFWGGNWYFYDTMHFEYRPELLNHPETIVMKKINGQYHLAQRK